MNRRRYAPRPRRRTLTPEQVATLRLEAARATLRELEGRYGICKTSLQKIIRGQTYRDVMEAGE